jgi:hypothetical protein
MPPEGGEAARLIGRLESAFAAFEESFAGLPDVVLVQPGAAGDWSVKDVLAHVSTWEEEALEHLPTIAVGGTPPRYAATGGIDAFNARAAERNRELSLSDVRRMLEASHRRLVEYLLRVPSDLLAEETRFRRRLRVDTYGHYRLHARHLREWRARLS